MCYVCPSSVNLTRHFSNFPLSVPSQIFFFLCCFFFFYRKMFSFKALELLVLCKILFTADLCAVEGGEYANGNLFFIYLFILFCSPKNPGLTLIWSIVFIYNTSYKFSIVLCGFPLDWWFGWFLFLECLY